MRYFCEDEQFLNLKEDRNAKPKDFDQILDAQKALETWQYRYIAIANDWSAQIEPVIEKGGKTEG